MSRLAAVIVLASLAITPLTACLAGEPQAPIIAPLEQVASHPGRALLPVLQPGDPVRLVREPDHPFQPGAVAAYWGEFKLGYLPAALSGTVCSGCAEGEVPAARVSAVAGQGVALELLHRRAS